MPVAVVKASTSTWVYQVTKSGYPTAGALRVTEASGAAARSYIFCALAPMPPGAVVSNATLTVYVVGPASGWGALSVRRVTNRIPDSQKTWANQPSVGGVQSTVTPSGTVPDATPVTFDLTALVSAWATGTLPNFGVQIQNAGATLEMLYSANSPHPPVLNVTYATPPDTPHNLAPNGVISLAKPVVGFGPYGDPDGDGLQAIQVQVAPTAAGFGTPSFDSGAVASVAPQLDLSTTSFGGFGSTAQYWRSRVQDSSGMWSSWSDPASCTVTAKPTVSISTPSSGSPFVREATPQIVWTAAGMTSWRVQILDASTLAILADSEHVPSTIPGWGVPAGVVQPGGSYVALVYVWDVSRSPSPGDTTYTLASQAFTFSPGIVAAPTAVTAAQGPDWPGQVVVQCTESTAPDYFTVYLDGLPKLTQVAPGSALVSGSTYRFVLDQVPNGDHIIQVDAVTAGVASAPSAPLTYTQSLRGVWLGDPKRKLWFEVVDTQQSPDQWVMKDLVTVTDPIDGTVPQQIIRAMKGLAGPCTGLLVTSDVTASVANAEAIANNLKGTPQNTLRLLVGRYNIPVKVSNLHVGPSSLDSPVAPVATASFDFFQCGEFAFKASL